ncbi:MAG: OmpP1/FadL family transporter [Acidiferrobacter sp.]
MVSTKKWALASAVAAALALPVTAMATTAGYFQLGYSTVADGMAGASAALPQDSMIQATNPAGIAFVGNRLDIGAAGFWPFRAYTAGAGGFPYPGSYGSSTNFFLIPHIGYTQRLSANNFVGIAVYGNGGLNTNYHFPAANPSMNPAGGPFYDGQTGVNLQQLFVQFTYARRFLRHDSIGLSLLAARQSFSADGLGAFARDSSNSSDLTGNGASTSTGVGVKIGGQFRIMPGLNFGVAFSPRMKMSKFHSYAGLFANQGQFDIPANGVVGLAFKPTRRQVVAFDFQRIYYGDVPAIADPINSLLTGTKLGADNGPGFGWQDISVYKLGYQIQTSRNWTWRAGFAYNTQPIQPSQVLFNVLAPGVIQRDVTAGFTTRVAHRQNVSVAAMYGLPQAVYGNAPAAFGGAPIKIDMHEYQLEANWDWKF